MYVSSREWTDRSAESHEDVQHVQWGLCRDVLVRRGRGRQLGVGYEHDAVPLDRVAYVCTGSAWLTTELCLDVTDGQFVQDTIVQTWVCHDSCHSDYANQQWALHWDPEDSEPSYPCFVWMWCQDE